MTNTLWPLFDVDSSVLLRIDCKSFLQKDIRSTYQHSMTEAPTAADLADKLKLFQDYFNRQRVHSGLSGRLPEPGEAKVPLNFASYRWQQHCRGLYETPIAA
jgi:hypothetical protein